MRYLAFSVLICGVAQLSEAQPRLVVLLVIDQMRAGFLDDFAEDYDDGIRRLIDEGAVFDHAFHDHALTETSPGHATIVTGTYPSRHGIVGNDIWDRQNNELIGSVLDPGTRMVGAERRYGRSPRRLMRSAIGDWLQAQLPGSKVFGVSLKDRSAIFAAGLHPDGAYWYDERAGRFVTSDYYRDPLPVWAVEFNRRSPADAYFGTSWTALFNSEHYRIALPSEGRPGIAYSEFPHLLVGDGATPDRRYYTRLRLTPFADRLTLDFSEALIESEGLGVDDTPDFVAIGLSAGDYIGHRYGPWSAEVHDHYARLDDYLGEFLAFLDRRVGVGHYSLALSADHGVMPMPERIAEHGGEAARVHPDELLAMVEPLVHEALGRNEIPAIPTLRYESGVILDFGDAAIAADRIDKLAMTIATALLRHPAVAATFTHAQLRNGEGGGNAWFGWAERSFYADRAPDIVVIGKENVLITEESSRAAHGSPYDYDTHVPLIFFGAGVYPGRHDEPVRTVDIAPTLAAMLGIRSPTDVDGRDLSERLQSAQ